jgi:hypothetical protein
MVAHRGIGLAIGPFQRPQQEAFGAERGHLYTTLHAGDGYETGEVHITVTGTHPTN